MHKLEAIKRRALLAGAASVAATKSADAVLRHGSESVTSSSGPSTPLTIVVTQGGNTYTYAESAGTAQPSNYTDSFGRGFQVSRTTITRGDFALRVSVDRIVGNSSWYQVIGDYGDVATSVPSPTNRYPNLPLAPYTFTINSSAPFNVPNGH